ncbi:hypothetical protein [Halalkalicoccus salilacus]|uniref:hypothetical protein n=1 Tax=Halalkalicoccus sp. GCM10025704 TaxID=3252662 RepID=UPI00361AC311
MPHDRTSGHKTLRRRAQTGESGTVSRTPAARRAPAGELFGDGTEHRPRTRSPSRTLQKAAFQRSFTSRERGGTPQARGDP